MVSFDVVALFTSIPVELAVQIAASRLDKDLTLVKRTSLLAQDVVELLEFCLKSTEFQFRGRYYKQIHGTAMGSPVSVIVANLVMEELEIKALNTFVDSLRFYYRFVDDTITALKKSQISNFHDHLNTQSDHIKFTVERYNKKEGLAFLDTLNKVSDDGMVHTKVYRKPMHSDRYLPFDSHHPRQHKNAVARTLFREPVGVCNDAKEQKQEEKRVYKVLRGNGYPKEMLTRICREIGSGNLSVGDAEQPTDLDKGNGLVVLPYIQGTTERLKRTLIKNGFKVAMRPVCTLKKQLVKPKDVLSIQEQTGVVYSIPCAGCDVEYIGETGRAFGTREKEHKAAVRLGKIEKSALAKHGYDCEHGIAWNDSKLLCKESRWAQRKWKEACMIEQSGNGISNRDNGRILPDVYKPILKK
ncbi:uncharacterized protein LOC114538574 [Dendronephthya gigantea]|uniref:uncharacterized protein LOC114538574 n=1 Tax=Dendronephthya gigantea TaxID=151771 RepID=UPI00106AB0B8|nr:uncharacterized protein LOC114538574 [Dendronephthya gigantea]